MSAGGAAGSAGSAAGSAGGAAGSSGGSAGSSGGSAGASGGSAGSAGGAVGSGGGSVGSSGGTGGSNGGEVAKPLSTGTPRHVRHGCLPDTPDGRDFQYTPTIDTSDLPPHVDLRNVLPPVYAQGNLGSCSANAIGAAIEYDLKRHGQESFTPSRLFIYYNERALEGTIHADAGAMLRSGIKTISRLGAPPEHLWPYDEAAVFKQPHQDSYAAAKLDLVTVYTRVLQSLPMMKACLAEGWPIVFRVTTYGSFDSSWNTGGDIPLPAPDEKDEGGHAMLLAGYDEAQQLFIVRNSWGPEWGNQGYGTIPYAYVLSPKWTTDLWTIRGVKQRQAKAAYSPFEPREAASAAPADAASQASTADAPQPEFHPHAGAGGTAR